jgi:hypothetical protein
MAGTESKEQPHIPLHVQRSEAIDKVKRKKAAEARVKQLRLDFAITFNSAESRRVLRWLMEQCGYQRGSVGGNAALGMDVAQGTIYNESRRGLYCEFRQYVPEETLKQVEYLSIEENFP